jgi:hypothetical protein
MLPMAFNTCTSFILNVLTTKITWKNFKVKKKLDKNKIRLFHLNVLNVEDGDTKEF